MGGCPEELMVTNSLEGGRKGGLYKASRLAAKHVMASFSNTVWTLIQPGHLLLLMLVGGCVMTVCRGTRRIGLWCVGVATALLVLIALFPVGTMLLLPLEDRFDQPVLSGDIDGIIVLGGGQAPAVTQSRGQATLNDNAERLIEAARLFRLYPDAQRVFTGGNGSHGLTEADVARMTFEALGIDPATVLFEDSAGNTYDNAILTFGLLEPEPGEAWLLITSAYHMPRALGAFRKAGWDILAMPVDYQTVAGFPEPFSPGLAGNLRALTLALHEYVGLLAYKMMDRTDELFPGPGN